MDVRANVSDEHRESQFNIVGVNRDTAVPNEDVPNDNYGVKSGLNESIETYPRHKSNRSKHGSNS